MSLQAKVKCSFHNPRRRQAKLPSHLSRVAVKVTTGLVGSRALLVPTLLHYRLLLKPLPPLWGHLQGYSVGQIIPESAASVTACHLLTTQYNFPSARQTLPVSFSIFLMLYVTRLVLLLLNSVTRVSPPCSPPLFSKHFGY